MALPEKTLAEIGQLALKMRQHPETRKEFAKLAKKVVPSLNFPDVDQEERIEGVISKFNEDRETEKAQAAKDALTQRLESEKSELLTRYTEDQVKEIEKLMLNRGLASYADAAILYAHFNPPSQAPMNHPQTSFELPTDKDWLTNPKKKALNTAYSVIDEIRNKAQRRTA